MAVLILTECQKLMRWKPFCVLVFVMTAFLFYHSAWTTSPDVDFSIQEFELTIAEQNIDFIGEKLKIAEEEHQIAVLQENLLLNQAVIEAINAQNAERLWENFDALNELGKTVRYSQDYGFSERTMHTDSRYIQRNRENGILFPRFSSVSTILTFYSLFEIPMMLYLTAIVLGAKVGYDEYRSHSLDFTMSQPYSRRSVYLAKCMAALLISVFAVFLSVLIFSLVHGLRYGWGQFAMPLAIDRQAVFFGRSDEVILISTAAFLFFAFLTQVMLAALMIEIETAVGLFLKSPYIPAVVGGLGCFLPPLLFDVLINQKPIVSFLSYVPFLYGFYGRTVITGKSGYFLEYSLKIHMENAAFLNRLVVGGGSEIQAIKGVIMTAVVGAAVFGWTARRLRKADFFYE